jgi:hypothetical protein
MIQERWLTLFPLHAKLSVRERYHLDHDHGRNVEGEKGTQYLSPGIVAIDREKAAATARRISSTNSPVIGSYWTSHAWNELAW